MSNKDRSIATSNLINSFSMTIIVGATMTTTASLFIIWRAVRRNRKEWRQQHPKNLHDNTTTSITSDEIRQLQQQRKEERTGRIRAEVRLRTTLKHLQQLQIQLLHSQQLLQKQQKDNQPISNGRCMTICESSEDEQILDDQTSNIDSNDSELSNYNTMTNIIFPQNRTMVLQCIGTVVTPYTKRMGTPRQGALVPASRGYVQFDKHVVSAETISGLESYSHLWVLFEFHANTDLGSNNYNNNNNTAASSSVATTTKTKKSKIRPPRGNGIKVGQLATRSPHRPNPIGLSLVAVGRWDTKLLRLHISGLDIVNGTPVYDIKPVVPWDIPGYQNNNSIKHVPSVLVVPDWVSCNEDVIENVTFTNTAKEQLQQCILQNKLEPLYTIENNGQQGAMDTIIQILQQDPRSSHKGLKSNARGTKNATSASSSGSSSTSCYSIIFCNVRVSFTVTEGGCAVTDVDPIEFERNQYVDGVPLITEGLIEAQSE